MPHSWIPWPNFPDIIQVESTVNLVIQINGKKKNIIKIAMNQDQEDVMSIINTKFPEVSYKKSDFKRIIFIKNKIINFVK